VPIPGLPWQSSPTRELARLAWPIAISMVSYAVMTLVDTLFVARLGAGTLAGVGLGGTAAFAVLCFSFGLLRGVKVLVSQAVGAGRGERARDLVASGIAWALVLGVASVLLGQLVAEAMPLIAASAESGETARTYTSIRLLGAPLVLVYVAIREARYGVGDARSPMVAAVLANAANVALDYTFIVVLERGAAGAAIASVLATVAALVMMLAIQTRSGFGRFSWRGMARIWRVGFPTGIQFLLEMGAFAMLAMLLAALDEVEMAAHQIALQVIHFTFLPVLAVSEAASVLAGQAVGARRSELVVGVARRALWLGAAYAVLCTLVLVGFAGPIARSFTDEAPLLERSIQLLWVAAVFQLFDAAQAAARGVLRGAGDVRFPAVIGIVTAWICTPPLTWLLGYELGLGALGGWVGLCLEIVVAAALLWWRLASDGWRAASEKTRAELDADEDAVPNALPVT